jgi:hypothetical protein
MVTILVSALSPPIVLMLPVAVVFPCLPVSVNMFVRYTLIYNCTPVIPWETHERRRNKPWACDNPRSIIPRGPIPPSATGTIPAALVKDNFRVNARHIICVCARNYRKLWEQAT